MKTKNKKCKTVGVKKDGWSFWQYPQMKGYLLQCCGCGLVHEVEFEVLKVIKQAPNGTMLFEAVGGYRVGLRMKRAKNEEGIEVT